MAAVASHDFGGARLGSPVRPAHKRRVAALTRAEQVDQRLRVAPPGLRDVPEPRESLLELLERVDRLVAVRPKLGNGRESEPGVHQNQTVDPLGMHGYVVLVPPLVSNVELGREQEVVFGDKS